MQKNYDEQPVTRKVLKETLGEFTEEILVPTMDRMMDQKLGELKTDLKDYTDKKVGGLKGDLVSVIKTGKERDQRFKHKMVQIVEQNKLAPADDIALLEQLAE
jgi:hypothetical protein